MTALAAQIDRHRDWRRSWGEALWTARDVWERRPVLTFTTTPVESVAAANVELSR